MQRQQWGCGANKVALGVDSKVGGYILLMEALKLIEKLG